MAHGEDFEVIIKELKSYIRKNLKELTKLSEEELVEQRYKKFRTMC